MPKFYKGLFKPNHPEKYKGDHTNIVYRSHWEFKVMSFLDRQKDILKWNSEEIIIPYRSPLDGRIHRYFPDFWIQKKNFSDGKIEEALIEVKPKKQTQPPAVQSNKKPSKRYLTEVKTWGINSAKWKAADKYCKDRGWNFFIFTEDHIGTL